MRMGSSLRKNGLGGGYILSFQEFEERVGEVASRGFRKESERNCKFKWFGGRKPVGIVWDNKSGKNRRAFIGRKSGSKGIERDGASSFGRRDFLGIKKTVINAQCNRVTRIACFELTKNSNNDLLCRQDTPRRDTSQFRNIDVVCADFDGLLKQKA